MKHCPESLADGTEGSPPSSSVSVCPSRGKPGPGYHILGSGGPVDVITDRGYEL